MVYQYLYEILKRQRHNKSDFCVQTFNGEKVIILHFFCIIMNIYSFSGCSNKIRLMYQNKSYIFAKIFNDYLIF
jgi:hypothetical protein